MEVSRGDTASFRTRVVARRRDAAAATWIFRGEMSRGDVVSGKNALSSTSPRLIHIPNAAPKNTRAFQSAWIATGTSKFPDAR